MAAHLPAPLEFLPNLDGKIDQLVLNIVEKLRFDPPEADVKIRGALSSATVRIKEGGTYDINALSMLRTDGTPFVSIGRGLYPFVQQYASCAAAYFLPREPGGNRPSRSWPIARDRIAASLEALALPDTEPSSYDIPLSEHQAERALIFGNYTFRFIVCHELAHVALGHVAPDFLESREIDGDLRAILLARHDLELAADSFGLGMQIKSLESSLLEVTAVAAAVYFLYATDLLRLRLMILARLVDYKEWAIEGRHPPLLQRFLRLEGQAIGLCEEASKEGLMILRQDLDALNGQIRTECNRRREETALEATAVIRRSAKKIAGGVDRELQQSLQSQIAALYDMSPIGLAEAFDENVRIASQSDDQATLDALNYIMSILPRSLRQFLQLSRRNRTRRCLLKPLFEDG